MEDFITWVNTSAIKRHIMEYNNLVRFDERLLRINFISYQYSNYLFVSEGRFRNDVSILCGLFSAGSKAVNYF